MNLTRSGSRLGAYQVIKNSAPAPALITGRGTYRTEVVSISRIRGDDADIQARGVSSAVSASELPLFTWLRAGYPELFDREHLTERIWLYDICFRIRQACACGRLDPRSRQDLADLTLHPRVRFP